MFNNSKKLLKEIKNNINDEYKTSDKKEKIESKKLTPKQRRINKIFNNKFDPGGKIFDDNYIINAPIEVDRLYADTYLKDIYQVHENIGYNILQEEVIKLLETKSELKRLIDENYNKRKFNKKTINLIFKILFDHFNKSEELRLFLNPIYIFDLLSDISGLKYTNLFDLMYYEHKEMLVVELNKTHNIIKSYSKFKKLF